MERRTFLGAAAAVAALPATGEAAGEEFVEEYRESDDGTYREWRCGSVPGSLNDVSVEAGMNDDPLTVTAIREADGWEGVVLRWTSGPVEVGTGLSADGARALAQKLWTAAAGIDGDLEKNEEKQ